MVSLASPNEPVLFFSVRPSTSSLAYAPQDFSLWTVLHQLLALARVFGLPEPFASTASSSSPPSPPSPPPLPPISSADDAAAAMSFGNMHLVTPAIADTAASPSPPKLPPSPPPPPAAATKFPHLAAFHATFEALPQNQKYLSSPLHLLMPFNNKTARFGSAPSGAAYIAGTGAETPYDDLDGIY